METLSTPAIAISTSNRCSKEALRQAFSQCRLATLNLFADVDEDLLRCHAHPDFSPIGWHLGHIAMTEAMWLLDRRHTDEFPSRYRQLFAADGLPKHERVNLPSLSELRYYLDTVRDRLFATLETATLSETDERLWHFIWQHEAQHDEIIAFVKRLANIKLGRNPNPEVSPSSPRTYQPDSIEIPAGEVQIGSNALSALDNERSTHTVYLDTYRIDRYPVTQQQYRHFIEAGGYRTRKWWSDAGWAWLQAHPVSAPLYWQDDRDRDFHPVCGVNYYEAEAYANFTGKRLPTEAEWEKAASWHPELNRKQTYPWGDTFPNPNLCHCAATDTASVGDRPDGNSAYSCAEMLGNVWEWTASWFAAYPGFAFHPYKGYSQTYFDGEHRVLRGGSWATSPLALRSSLRNWYYPHIRQILAGFRCVGANGVRP